MKLLDLLAPRHLPMFLQAEMAECGLASFAMVAAYHGHKVDLNSLRQRFALSLKGATLKDLITIAGTLRFGCRPLRVELHHLPELAAPCILHWDLNHFVVLKSANKRDIVIHDPALGIRRMSMAEASKHFSGIALEISPASDFEPVRLQVTTRLSDLWSRVVGLKRAAIQAFLLSALLQVFALIAPAFLQLTVDEAVTRYDREFMFVLAAGFGVMYVLQALTEALRSWVVLYLGQHVTFQMNANLLHHLLRLPADFFEKRMVGDILSRMSSTRPIQQVLTQSVVVALIDGLMAAATLLALFAYSAALGAVVAGTVGAYLAIVLTTYPWRRMRENEQLMAQAIAQTHMIESIRASKTIKLYGGEGQREAVWRNHFATAIRAALRAGHLDIVNQGARTLLFGLQIVLVVYIAADMVMRGQFTVGMLLAFMLYRANFVERADALTQRLIEFRLLRLHLERIADIVQTPKEPDTAGEGVHESYIRGNMALRGCSFQYASNEPFVLSDISLQIHEGDFIAITGASGGGKTTLLKILLGLLPPTSGQVLVEGRPISSIGMHSWRAALGVVQQDDGLLMGTIADNIAFFDPNIDMERVMESARAAHVDADIRAMPMGYLSMVGDMGSSLSGGQKQRVLLARALYRKPKVLFLDEGTANLDAETERRIADVIEELPITRIVVAHRPELIARATRVITVAGGRLHEGERKVSRLPVGTRRTAATATTGGAAHE